jgi:L-ascorbate metabolism protein UlaG (beta-lactamase superfamily)
MQITKLGYCCLVLDIDGVKILTDPGSYTTAQNNLTGINIVLITHEHADHFHVDSLTQVLANNPHAVVVTNAAVASCIEKENILTTVNIVGDGQLLQVNGVSIEGFGTEHALIYGDMGKCENTGYLVAEKFYFPGDNFEQPHKAVDVLALPVAGPWMKMSECVDFAKAINARIAFGVHDGMIAPGSRGFTGMILKRFVPDTEYVSLVDGETREF